MPAIAVVLLFLFCKDYYRESNTHQRINLLFHIILLGSLCKIYKKKVL